MKKLLLAIAFVMTSLVCYAQKQKLSVVELQNGSVIHGVILESSQGTIKIQTSDKSVFVYPESDIVKISEEKADSKIPRWESTVLVNYTRTWGAALNANPTSDIGLEYILDYLITNVFFMELGVFATYSFMNNPGTGEYLRYPYGGLYLGFGFNINIGNKFRLTPFLRGGGMVGYYDKAWLINDWGRISLVPSKGFGYGGFPELGLRFSYGPFVLSASGRLYYASARLRAPGLCVGLGYRF